MIYHLKYNQKFCIVVISQSPAEEDTKMQELTDREKELLDLVREHPELLDQFITELSTAQAAHPAPRD